jgi:cysteine-rich repeat protein
VTRYINISICGGFIVILATAMGSCLGEPGLPCGNGYCPAGHTCRSSGTDSICMDSSAECGNSKLEKGEGCDDGNIIPGDDCSRLCQTEVCGNGLWDYDEECDDGNRRSGDGCNEDCAQEKCGDGQIKFDEECDCGELPVDGSCPWPPLEDGGVPSGTCLADCTLEDESLGPPER